MHREDDQVHGWKWKARLKHTPSWHSTRCDTRQNQMGSLVPPQVPTHTFSPMQTFHKPVEPFKMPHSGEGPEP